MTTAKFDVMTPEAQERLLDRCETNTCRTLREWMDAAKRAGLLTIGDVDAGGNRDGTVTVELSLRLPATSADLAHDCLVALDFGRVECERRGCQR